MFINPVQSKSYYKEYVTLENKFLNSRSEPGPLCNLCHIDFSIGILTSDQSCGSNVRGSSSSNERFQYSCEDLLVGLQSNNMPISMSACMN